MKPARTLLQTALAVCLSAVGMHVTFCAPPKHERPVAEGLLTGKPCGPPCWQGLVPGTSTEAEADAFLAASEYVDGVHKEEYWKVHEAQWRPSRQTSVTNSFAARNGVLIIMNMYLDSVVTLGQVVERYGPPDKFEARRSAHPEPVYIVVSLFYREHGMMLGLRLSDDDPELRPETEVVTVEYYQPAPLEEVLLTSAWGYAKPRTENELKWLEESLKDWRNWQGYGSVIRQPEMLPPGLPGTP
jgi:hypothetical protein